MTSPTEPHCRFALSRWAVIPAALLAACGTIEPTPSDFGRAPDELMNDARVGADATRVDVSRRDVRATDASSDVSRAPDAAVDATTDSAPMDAARVDAGAADAGTAAGCAPYAPRERIEPCAGGCGLASQTQVRIEGATDTLREFQVRVTLPAAVRAEAGAACEALMFRDASGAWAPHWVQDCAAGVVWVRAPQIEVGGTELTMRYGGAGVAAANSYDDVFDRVPLGAAGLLGAWTFDEGTGTRTCPSAGSVAFDAYLHATPYNRSVGEVAVRPMLWSNDVPASVLAPGGRFSRGNHSLNFPRMNVIDNPARPTVTHPGRLVNWQTPDSRPLRAAERYLTVGLWVYTSSPANAFGDNWQTVIAYGMPAEPTPPYPGANVSQVGIFNPWAMFFRSDTAVDSYLFANSCAYPCLTVDQYAHIASRAPMPSYVGRWHFVAMTVDTTSTPHATRRAYYDGQVLEYPRDMLTWPEDRYCTGSTCRYPPEGRVQYYNAPVLLGADMNDGDPGLGLEGRLDDLFIVNRAVSSAEMAAWRERRQYSPDPITATVAP